MHIVYILYLNNGNLYKGYTTNLQKRFDDHKNGRVKSTKPHRPVTLIHHEIYALESDARRREKFLKTNVGRKLLKQQLRDILSEFNET